MMTLKERFAEIGRLLALKFEGVPAPIVPAPAVPAPAALATDYPLADGQVLTIDTLAVGGIVTISGAPAPDAEYTLADGSVVTTAGGIITVIVPKVVAAVEPEEMKTPEQMQAALQKFADGVVDPNMQKITTILKAVFENVFGWQLREAQEKATRDQAIAAYQQGFAAVTEENKTLRLALVEMNAVVEEIGKGLVEEPIENVEPGKLTAFQKHQLKYATV